MSYLAVTAMVHSSHIALVIIKLWICTDTVIIDAITCYALTLFLWVDYLYGD